ncbi:MAG: hypothetical protein RMY16_05140 [Nostoc sp. DedQUE12b]|nr:hypothetical protein [Nostoc sp. DedQUE12b]MDZ8084971.1 hypothetical protein [Nostoc sp. DedQUE12b]
MQLQNRNVYHGVRRQNRVGGRCELHLLLSLSIGRCIYPQSLEKL